MTSVDAMTMDLFSTDAAFRRENLTENKPIYENHPTLLKKYVGRATKWVSDYAKEKFGFEPSFRNVRVGIAKLPTMYQRVLEIGRDYIRQRIVPVGKVFGSYNPETKEMKIDSVVVPEINDPERYVLKKAGLKIPSAESVITHESVHSVQDESGAIWNYLRKFRGYARDKIEGMAEYVTDRIMGHESPIYAGPKRRIKSDIRQHGERNVFLGRQPAYAA